MLTECPLFATPVLGTSGEEQNKVDKNLCPHAAPILWGGPLSSGARACIGTASFTEPNLIPVVTIFHLLLWPLASSSCWRATDNFH